MMPPQNKLGHIIDTRGFRLFSKWITVRIFESNSRQDGSFGRSDDLMNEVTINSSMPEDNQQETLLHEVLHQIEQNLGLGLTETQVQGLSVGIFDFLKSNGIIE